LSLRREVKRSGIVLLLGWWCWRRLLFFEVWTGFALAFAILLGWTAETAFCAWCARTASFHAWGALSTRTFTAAHATAAHHFAHPGHALSEFVTRKLSIAILIHAAKGLFHEFSTPFWGRWTAFRATSLGAAHAFAFRTATFGALSAFRSTKSTLRGWAISAWGTVSFGGWAAEASVATLRAAHALALWTAHAFRATTAGSGAHAFGHLADLSFVDEAVAIGVHPAKGLFLFGSAKFDELVFADFAVGVCVGAFQHFAGVAGCVRGGTAGRARAFAFLAVTRGSDEGAAKEGAEEEGGADFHGGLVRGMGLASIKLSLSPIQLTAGVTKGEGAGCAVAQKNPDQKENENALTE
jgi:hypothetical protein